MQFEEWCSRSVFALETVAGSVVCCISRMFCGYFAKVVVRGRHAKRFVATHRNIRNHGINVMRGIARAARGHKKVLHIYPYVNLTTTGGWVGGGGDAIVSTVSTEIQQIREN